MTFLKRGRLRSKNTTAGERYCSGPLREQQPLAGTVEEWRIEIHQPQPTFVIQMVNRNQSTSSPEN